MKNWEDAHSDQFSSICGVCFDIDDTITTDGQLKADAYNALWDLKASGFYLIPITGRPAAWCDHIIRFWPVDAIIGENGALVFYMDSGVRKRIDYLGDEAVVMKEKLNNLTNKIIEKFPHAKWASDQAYREYDLAIDICEDVAAWKEEDVTKLLNLCHEEGAQAKLSSIHVNTWFGKYDKGMGIDMWLDRGTPGITGENITLDKLIFIGDSPNDAPLFEKFSLSVGVANVKAYHDQLSTPPTWVTDGESGTGFCEFAKQLIAFKK
ncbi:MAG: HAD-IIB family hydrolase [Bacteriovoracaceae bacterium]|nr:HAD-IIB family hydrolase [Bacteriovoracaceae bacterium]